jgi:hypothetical protein
MSFPRQVHTRRRWLESMGAGFGSVALAGALHAEQAVRPSTAPIPHFAPRAKRVLFLFMNGAPSHVDTFDPKPALEKYRGQQPEGMTTKGSGFMPSPFRFAAHGQSGVVMSELFPQLAECADDLCVIRSMHTDVPNHEPGLLVMHSGHQQPTRPCLGSWISYGLGSIHENLPSFIALCPGLPVVGPQLWSSAFLPGEHQGMAVDTNDMDVEKLVANLRHPSLSRTAQREQLDLLQRLNREHLQARPGESALDTHIRAMEMAFQMQVEASEAFDIQREPEAVREAYGATEYGRSCLLARRLLERGVRYVQVYYVTKKGKQPWDTHTDNDGQHRKLCADSDRATATLLKDLKMRGLLEDTLVIWGGEFGRTPYSQLNTKNEKSKPGRDHHHTGFSMFLAGGGVRGGMMYGSTDELGMHAIENRVHVHDLHATILHLLGMDHTRLTYHYSGRDFRLTDIHGRVVDDIIDT